MVLLWSEHVPPRFEIQVSDFMLWSDGIKWQDLWASDWAMGVFLSVGQLQNSGSDMDPKDMAVELDRSLYFCFCKSWNTFILIIFLAYPYMMNSLHSLMKNVYPLYQCKHMDFSKASACYPKHSEILCSWSECWHHFKYQSKSMFL